MPEINNKRFLSINPGLPRWLSHKESTCKAEDLGFILGLLRSPGEGMATHSSILAWEIPCPEEPGGLQSIALQRVGHYLVTKQQQWRSTSYSFLVEMAEKALKLAGQIQRPQLA